MLSLRVLPREVRGIQALRQCPPALRIGHEQPGAQQGLEAALSRPRGWPRERRGLDGPEPPQEASAACVARLAVGDLLVPLPQQGAQGNQLGDRDPHAPRVHARLHGHGSAFDDEARKLGSAVARRERDGGIVQLDFRASAHAPVHVDELPSAAAQHDVLGLDVEVHVAPGVQPGHGHHDFLGDLENAFGRQRRVPLAPLPQQVLQGAIGQLGHDVHAAVRRVLGRLAAGVLGEPQEPHEEVGGIGAGQLLAPQRVVRGPLEGPLHLLEDADLPPELGERGRKPSSGGLVHLDCHGLAGLNVAAKVART
mmetsp:Transcript_52048/g.140335  ORF Transcript_52048/g.140335 Transcript_52048/m.140335 type:complete len:309 (-) Transcript_52048:418-1344(-)